MSEETPAVNITKGTDIKKKPRQRPNRKPRTKSDENGTTVVVAQPALAVKALTILKRETKTALLNRPPAEYVDSPTTSAVNPNVSNIETNKSAAGVHLNKEEKCNNGKTKNSTSANDQRKVSDGGQQKVVQRSGSGGGGVGQGRPLTSNGGKIKHPTVAESFKRRKQFNNNEGNVGRNRKNSTSALKQATIDKILLENECEKLTDEELRFIEAEYIFPLNKKSERFQLAVCYCRLCEYHINTMAHAKRHISSAEHQACKQEKMLLNLLLSIPKPSVSHCAALNNVLLKAVEEHLPPVNHTKLCTDIVDTLTNLFKRRLHDACYVRMYGSCASGFALKSANLNLELMYSDKQLNHATALMKANEIIRSHTTTFFNVTHDFCCKWPYVQFTFVKGGQVIMPNVVLSVRNTQAYEICEFLKTYTDAFPCLTTMGRIWRLWARMCELDNFRSGGLPAYAFDLMLIHYLQQTKPHPFIPVLHELSTNDEQKDIYERNIEKILKNTKVNPSSWNYAEIFIGLLRYYTVGNDSQSFVVNVRTKVKVAREVKGWTRKRLGIEDPFMPKKNLAQLSNEMFSYLMACLQNSYKYYGIPQTSTGPLFCYENRKLILTPSLCNNYTTKHDENPALASGGEPAENKENNNDLASNLNSNCSKSHQQQRSFQIVFNENVRNIPTKPVLSPVELSPESVNHVSPVEIDLQKATATVLFQQSTIVDNISFSQTGCKKSLQDIRDVQTLCDELVDKVVIDEVSDQKTCRRKRSVQKFCTKKLNDLNQSLSDEHGQVSTVSNQFLAYSRTEMLDIAKLHYLKRWPNIELIEEYKKRLDFSAWHRQTRRSSFLEKFGSQQLETLLASADYCIEIVPIVEEETNKKSEFFQSSSEIAFPTVDGPPLSDHRLSETEPCLINAIQLNDSSGLVDDFDVKLNFSDQSSGGGHRLNEFSTECESRLLEDDFEEQKRRLRAVDVDSNSATSNDVFIRPAQANYCLASGGGGADGAGGGEFISSDEPPKWDDLSNFKGESMDELSLDEDSGDLFNYNDVLKEIDRCTNVQSQNKRDSSDDSIIEFVVEDNDDDDHDNNVNDIQRRPPIPVNEIEIIEPELDLELTLAANSLEISQFRYAFDIVSLIGINQKPFICCELCGQKDHLSMYCTNPDKELPDLKPLKPLSIWYMDTITSFIGMVLTNNKITWKRQQFQEQFRRQLECSLQTIWPEAELILFGSSCNGFGFTHSDLDVCLTFRDRKAIPTETEAVKIIRQIAKFLSKHPEFGSVLPVTRAKVPIVRFYHHPSKLEGDVSLYNLLALRNTHLLFMYSQIDVRAQALGYMAKVFAKQCGIGDASRGSLSSYAYVIMVIHFLQQRKPAVLPVLQELYLDGRSYSHIVDNWETYFHSDFNTLPKVWKDCHRNKESLSELWLGFLRYYTETFDPRNDVVQIRRSTSLTKFEKLWTDRPLAIEDPFDLNHNLASGLSKKSNLSEISLFIYIMKAFRLAREVFGDIAAENLVRKNLWNCLSYNNLGTYLFSHLLKMEEPPPKDRVCRLCERVGHFVENCPLKRSNKGKLLKDDNSDDEEAEKKTVITVYNKQQKQYQTASSSNSSTSSQQPRLMTINARHQINIHQQQILPSLHQQQQQQQQQQQRIRPSYTRNRKSATSL